MEKKIAYHVTRKNNLKSIFKRGLIPAKPDDSIYDEDPAVFLFPTMDHLQNGITNWLGERIDNWEMDNNKKYNEIYLKVDITGLDCEETADYEISCNKTIPSSRIIDVTTPNGKKIFSQKNNNLF